MHRYGSILVSKEAADLRWVQRLALDVALVWLHVLTVRGSLPVRKFPILHYFLKVSLNKLTAGEDGGCHR